MNTKMLPEDWQPGRFELDWQLLVDQPEKVRAVMGECLIVRCEARYVSRTLEFEAFSKRFRKCHAYSAPPTYQWEWDDFGNVARAKEVDGVPQNRSATS